MPKPEWGVKRVCPTTGKRFYDMNRDPVVSPYSGEVVEIDSGASKTGFVGARTPSPAKSKAAKAPAPAEDPLLEDDATNEVEADLLEDDEDDSVSLDELADVAEKDDET